VVTTLEDESVAAVKARFPGVPAALSLGRDLAEVPRTRWAATRYGELWTVDDDAGIRRWLTDPRVTVLITNRPADAMAGRASLAAPA
jgi:glycerophosphoryl diester phosphodiesterase